MTKQTFFYAFLLLGTIFVCTDTVWGQSYRPAGQRHALLVGVNDYDNAGNEKRAKDAKRPYFELKTLSYCCGDMEELGEALAVSKFAPKENITVLTSTSTDPKKKSTMENINRAIKDLLSGLNENDTIFVAFAGHGLALPKYKGDSESELYLCPMDAEVICNPQSGKFDCSQLISRKDLEVKLENSKADVKIIVMDACRNIGVQTRSANLDMMEKSALDEIKKVREFESPNIVRIKGLFQLFSCDKGQTAAESDELKHGVYSHYMIEGLKNGSADTKGYGNGDGKITLAELQRYVKTNTESHAKGVLHHTQAPKITTDGDSTPEDVILAYCQGKNPVTPNSNSMPQNTANYPNSTPQNTANYPNSTPQNTANYPNSTPQNTNSGYGNNGGTGSNVAGNGYNRNGNNYNGGTGFNGAGNYNGGAGYNGGNTAYNGGGSGNSGGGNSGSRGGGGSNSGAQRTR